MIVQSCNHEHLTIENEHVKIDFGKPIVLIDPFQKWNIIQNEFQEHVLEEWKAAHIRNREGQPPSVVASYSCDYFFLLSTIAPFFLDVVREVEFKTSFVFESEAVVVELGQTMIFEESPLGTCPDL